ncbi:hypothetical protein [Achromobacter pestifer]|uniref:Uncharacterized protein n=1 Tax=Achromobacter pestifer TaxID=1353889 RepID=A0A6S6YPR2_9BURK|nr:hypothetical protein [Achromobacter pestifer]CAB3635332.1 hypothetical protein LMG3431_01495 [Achromobacter pestifer]
MKRITEYAGLLTEDSAVDLAESWALSHHKDLERSRNFAIQWHQETPTEERDQERLARDLSFFFEASSKDALYWRSVGDFTEEATGVWGMQALKALVCLNLTGLLVVIILFYANSAAVPVLGLLGAGIAFLVGVVLAIPALKLTAISRARASASAALHSHKAQTASTWEQLKAANNADPNVGRTERKVATRMALAMIVTAIIGCTTLIVTVWF